MSTESASTRPEEGLTRTREMEVLERIREIPEGFVCTYGDVSPGAPRFAGTVLFHADDPDLPWWRVVRADGSLAKGDRQRALLRAEGVCFRGLRVDMGRAPFTESA
ncbi:MAG TPA: MGMT family protein [Solirubrobacterales bacterium]|nr:MGMT family protein [Solirubrobacterales bacterium]